MPNYRAWKSLIAAAYNDIKIEVPAFELHKDNATPEFLEKNPLGKVPVLETPHGCIFESNAIARYVARLRQDTDLYGLSFFESAQVDQWIDFSANELEPTRAIWLFPVLGYMQFDQEAYESAKADVQKSLNVLEKHLQTRTYLVGNKVTLADITLISALVDLYRLVFDPAFRKPYVNVTRWFITCVNQPEFAKVIGEVKLTDKEQKADGAAAAGGKKDKKENKKEEKPKKEKAEKPKKNEEEPMDDEPKEEKKQPNPLDLLPPSSMNMDATKKLYFEKRPNFAAFFDEFWKFYDAEGYCMYSIDYNYNDENKVYFMTCNLMGGFIQRLDDLRKHGFGVLNLVGENEDTAPFRLNGCFLFRGKEVPAAMKECPDSEYYTFTRIDTNNEADRKKVEERFYAEKVDGFNVLDRRYFK